MMISRKVQLASIFNQQMNDVSFQVRLEEASQGAFLHHLPREVSCSVFLYELAPTSAFYALSFTSNAFLHANHVCSFLTQMRKFICLNVYWHVI